MILFAMKEGKVDLFFRFLYFYVAKQAFYSILTTQYSVPPSRPSRPHSLLLQNPSEHTHPLPRNRKFAVSLNLFQNLSR